MSVLRTDPELGTAGLLREVEQYLYREARYADEHDYDAWEALWTDDAIYWVPSGADDIDPTTTMSVIFDNRSRIGTRIRQLHTGKRHSQIPASRLRHLITNVELLDPFPGTEFGDAEIGVGANFVVYESRERGITEWAGRTLWKLRREDGELRTAYKKVLLINNDRPLNTLSFLI